MDLPAAISKATGHVNVKRLSTLFHPAEEDKDEVPKRTHDGTHEPSDIDELVSMFQSTTEATNSPQRRNAADIQKLTQMNVSGSSANIGTQRQISTPGRTPTLLVKPRVRPRKHSAPEVAYDSKDERTVHQWSVVNVGQPMQDDQKITKLQVSRKLSAPEAHAHIENSHVLKPHRPPVSPRLRKTTRISHLSEEFNPVNVAEHTSFTPHFQPQATDSSLRSSCDNQHQQLIPRGKTNDDLCISIIRLRTFAMRKPSNPN